MTWNYDRESFAVPFLAMPNLHNDSTAVPPRHIPLTRGQLGDDSRALFTHIHNSHRKQGAGNNTELSSVDERKTTMRASEKKQHSGPNQNIIALTFIFTFESKENF